MKVVLPILLTVFSGCMGSVSSSSFDPIENDTTNIDTAVTERRGLRSKVGTKAPGATKAPSATKSPKSSKAPTTATTSTVATTTTTTTTTAATAVVFYPFVSGSLDVNLDMGAIYATVEKLGGNLEEGRFLEGKEPFLTLEQCEAIREYTDQRWEKDVKSGADTAQGKNYTTDYDIDLEPQELAAMIGLTSVRHLHEAFLEYDATYPVRRIIARRSASAKEHHIQYHKDIPRTLMHVWLNGPDQAMVGGELVFLTVNGTQVVDTSITGAATFQSQEIVHGVANFDGTRYVLIFLGDDMRAPDVIGSFLRTATGASHTEL